MKAYSSKNVNLRWAYLVTTKNINKCQGWHNKDLFQNDSVSFGKSAVAVNEVHCASVLLDAYFFLALSKVYSVVVISTSLVLPAAGSVMTFFSHAHAHILFSIHAAVITDSADQPALFTQRVGNKHRHASKPATCQPFCATVPQLLLFLVKNNF